MLNEHSHKSRRRLFLEKNLQIQNDVDRICCRFECDWKASIAKETTQPSIESFLAECKYGIHKELLRELIVLEIELRASVGESAEITEYRYRFPQFTELVNEIFLPEIDEQPTRIDGFRDIRELGAGGNSTVYSAYFVERDVPVAIKVLSENQHPSYDLYNEAKIITQINHANVVTVYQVGEFEQSTYLVMELLDGTLESRIEKQRLEPSDAAVLFSKLASTLDHIHSKEILHMDIKPSNILFDSLNNPRISDFGFAVSTKQNIDRNSVGGTLGYLSPERLDKRFGQIGPPTDIFGLGVSLLQTLTGRVIFSGTADEIRKQILEDANPANPLVKSVTDESSTENNHSESVELPPIPSDLAAICQKCLHKNVDERYQSGQELAEDLTNFVLHRPVSARKQSLPGRLKLWVRREPIAAAFVTTLFTVAVLVGYLAVQYVKFNEKLSQEIRRADDNLLHQVQIVADLSTAIVEDPELFGSTSNTLRLRKSIAKKGADYYDDILQDLDTTKTRSLTARSHCGLGNVLSDFLGEYEDAAEAYKRAMDVTKPPSHELTTSWPLDFDWSLGAQGLASVNQMRGDNLAESRRLIEQAIKIQTRRLEISNTAPVQVFLANSYQIKGLLLRNSKLHSESLECFKKCSELCKSEFERPNPNQFCCRLYVAGIHNSGAALKSMGRLKDARLQFTKAEELSDDLVRKYPYNAEFKVLQARTMYMNAALDRKHGDYNAAKNRLDIAFHTISAISDENKDNPFYQSLSANICIDGAEYWDAEVADRRLSKIADYLAKVAVNKSATIQRSLARVLTKRGELNARLSLFNESLLLFKQASEIYQTLIVENPSSVKYQLDMAIYFYQQAFLFNKSKKFDLAEQQVNNAMHMLESTNVSSYEFARVKNKLLCNVHTAKGLIASRNGNYSDAVKMFKNAIKTGTANNPEWKSSLESALLVSKARFLIARCYEKQKLPAALKIYELAMKDLSEFAMSEDPKLMVEMATVCQRIAELKVAFMQTVEAETYLQQLSSLLEKLGAKELNDELLEKLRPQVDDETLSGLRESLLPNWRHKEKIAQLIWLEKKTKASLLAAKAFSMATHRNAFKRDGKKSLALAAEAAELSQSKDPFILSVLAAAYAENGQFNNAIRTIDQSLTLPLQKGQKELFEGYKRKLENQQPIRH